MWGDKITLTSLCLWHSISQGVITKPHKHSGSAALRSSPATVLLEFVCLRMCRSTWTETEVLIKHLGSNLPRTGPVISLCLELHSDTGAGTSGRSHSPPQTPGSHIEAVPISISSCSRGMMSLLYSIPINFTARSEEASAALRQLCETADVKKV